MKAGGCGCGCGGGCAAGGATSASTRGAGAPWMERESNWYAYSLESVWRDDGPAYEALRRAERAGDARKIERAEARLRKLDETRAARVAAEARGRYQRDAEAGANGASLEALGAYGDGAPKARVEGGTAGRVRRLLGGR